MNEFLLVRAPSLRRGALLALTAGVPLLFLRGTNSAFGVPKLALLVLLVLPLVALRVAEGFAGSSFEGLKRLLVPAGAVAGAMCIGWLFSPYKAWALWGYYDRFLGLIPYLLTIALGVLIADAFAEDARPVAIALGAAALLAGVYGIIQVAGLDPLSWDFESRDNTTAASTLGNPNFSGGFFAMCLPLFLGLWLSWPEKRRWIAVGGAVVVVAWIATDSQGGWAAGIAGLAVCGGILLSGRWGWARLAGAAVAAVVAIVLTGVVVLGLIDSGNNLVPTEAASRGWLWRAAVNMTLDSPLVGRGPHAYAIESTQHRTPEHAVTQNFNFADDPHSLPLSWGASAGVIGWAAFAVLAAWVIRGARRAIADDPLSVAFVGAATAYLVQSLVSIDTTPLRTTFWVVLGGFAATQARAELVQKRAKASRAPKRKGSRAKVQTAVPPGAVAAIAASVLVGLLCMVWASNFLRADLRFARAANLMSAGDLNEAMTTYVGAIEMRDDISYRRTYAGAAGRIAIELARSGELEPANGFLQRAQEAYSFTDDLPIVPAIDEEARLLQQWSEVTGTESQASPLYARAIALDPLNPLLRVVAANVLVEAGRPQDALDLLEPTLTMLDGLSQDLRDRVHPAYWEMLADVRAELGDETGAKEARERSEELEELHT